MLAQRVITGSIVDEFKQGLIGANIFAPLSRVGAATDLSGNFVIEVPSEERILEISFTGYESKQVDISNTNTISIQFKC